MDYQTYVIGTVVFSSLIGISYYKGLFSKITSWVHTKNQKIKMIMSLIDVLNNTQNTKSNPASFFVNDTDVSATISYERMGTKYILFVPYSREHVAQMTQFNVELLRDGKDSLNITQQPGIPYLVSANDLGGYAIKVTNEDNNTVYTYEHEDPPMYCKEVTTNE